MASRKSTALLIQLEFPTWKLARPWTYSANFAIQDALSQLEVECFTIPAIPGEQRSWLSHARSFCQNKQFDQVWLWLVHYHYDELFLDWISTLAPIRIGVLMESLHYGSEAYANSPGLIERPRIVSRQIQALTHVLTFDEQDAEDINASKSADAIWWPASVPRNCIVDTPAPLDGRKAVFHGNIYGSRRAWIDHPVLDRMLVPTKSSSESEFPCLFDELQQYARNILESGRIVSGQDLVQYISNLHSIRKGEFREWMRGLRASGPIINLPSYASFYGGRVFEGMAAGCPVLSFAIPNRPKTRTLFEDGKDILLFSQDDPSSLALQLDRLERDPVFSEKLMVHALQKIRKFHTVEWRVQQALAWVKNGKVPTYDESSEYGTLSDFPDASSTNSRSKDLRMSSDSPEGWSMSKCLPKGYIERVGHTQYLDTPGEFIYQPHVYELAGFLAERSGAKWIIDIGCGSGEKLQALPQEFRILGIDCSDSLNLAKERLPQGKFIDCDLENGLPQLSEEILRNAVVICSDVIEHLQRPDCLMQALAGLSKVSPFLLISTPDRDRARGWLDNGPPANQAHVMEWAATEFARFMKESGFGEGHFLGHTINTDFHLAKTTLLAVAGTQAIPPSSGQKTFRVAAIIHVYNEADILPEVIEHLYNEGIEVHIFDNWSDDDSWKVICSLKGLGKVTHAERFPEARINEYQWKRQLEKTETYAATLPVDWVMHHDADEIRMSPWRGVTLKNALAHIHWLGYSAVDHTVIDFRFLSHRNSSQAPYQTNLTHFEFGRRPGHFHQVKAWKNVGNIKLSNTGGHEAQFPDRRIYPIKFLIKHYPLRNLDQASKKVFQDRLPRVINEHHTLGWHSQYDQYSPKDMAGWLPKDLLSYHSVHFDTEYLVERISGIGLAEKKPEVMEETMSEVGAAILKNYTRDMTTNVWQRPEYTGIAYSDGDEIEKRLKNIITRASDVSVMSVELANHYTDWPSRYHLSNQRANLLRPFEEGLRGKQVLEIGAGCGAISRYLGEIGSDVFAIEGSPRRASIAALRCRDLKNVTVVAEAVQTLQCIQKFDVVTLIGVLEYARKFFPGEGKDPVDAMLKYVTGFLKPGGKLIIAIENQLGLKYFAGFLEDHMGEPMFGIEDQYDSSNVVTFGRKDLGDRVGRAGLTRMQWWYPFPDYKLPRLMISDQGALPVDDMNLFPLVRNACSKDLQHPSRVSFNQERAWRPVMRNGLLKEMANSFVLLASDREISDMSDRSLAIHYATDRRPEFAKKVVFSRTKNDAPMTYQIALYPQLHSRNLMVNQRLEHQAFVQGQLWQDRLIDIMTSPACSFEQIQQWFHVWVDAFYSAAGLVEAPDVMYKKISGKYIDMIPQNLFVDGNGAYTFIDQEWEYGQEIQVGYVVYRALITSLGEMKNFCKHSEQRDRQPLPLILKVAESVGFSFTNHELKKCIVFENTLQQYVLGKINSLNYETLSPHKGGNSNIEESKESCEKQNTNSPVFDCSIVIPVFNKVELTQQCLIQLANVTDGVSYEIIVVDNHSSDGTREFLETLDGDVQIIRNSENLGFAKGCNQGARASRGRYVVFLNNDTIPQPGWLQALVKEASAHSDVAIVGSKLLYPDNTVQHAGIVFNRKSGLPGHWANGVKKDSPLVSQRKQFKAVTAACMLVKREVFECVNGFDEAYMNGYEDVDFCLKVEQQNQKIIYQPESCLYHLESQTHGRQDHMGQNRDLFLSRWGNVWLEDEDIVAYEHDCAMVQVAQGQVQGVQLVSIGNELEKMQWRHVVTVQEMLSGSTRGVLKQGERRDQLHKVLSEHEQWPSDPGVLEWGGFVCETLGFEDNACEFWRKLVKIGNDVDARRSLIRSAIRRGQLDDAQMHLDILTENVSFSIEDVILQGTLFIQRQEFDKAISLFEDGLARNPLHQKVRLGLGVALLGQGKATEAFEVFQSILRDCPDDQEAIHWIVRAGTDIKDWSRIAEQLEKFLIRNPANCDMRFALAGVYLQGEMNEKSQKEYEILRLLKPDLEGLDDLSASLSIPSPQTPIIGQNEGSKDLDLAVSSFPKSQDASISLEKNISVLVSDTICGAVRLVMPLLACIKTLGVHGKIFNALENDNVKNALPEGPDEVWLSHRTNVIDADILKMARHKGTRVVHDIDDLIWNVPDDNPNASLERIRSPKLREFLPLVDCVTVATDPIKNFLSTWGIESFVLPNCLFPQDWAGLSTQSRGGRRPRVGWAGQTRVHMADLALLNAVIEALGDEVEWVFLGDAPECMKNSRIPNQVYPMAAIEDYPQALANLHLDVALAPLELNEFNEAKSDIRILQYGILGYPVIATDIYPHRQAPIERVPNDTAAWVRAIRDRIYNLNEAQAEGEKLRQWVLASRMIGNYLPQYQAVWLGLPDFTQEGTSTTACGPGKEVILDRNETVRQFTKDCSIIIPVFNKAELTKQCLTELMEITSGVSYEVIVIDNNSTDETQEILESFLNEIQVIRNTENLGFAKACNQGARVARGKYVTFLNNDTIPQRGWLKALVEEAESDHNIAIVGSKLLYPDGTLQHGGVAISRSTLTPYHIYRGLPGESTFANRRREFQAVTAACMLVKRTWFDAVGGFDEAYRNGFEDIDLCLNIGEKGGKVVYQPKSWLYHLEGQTPGRNLHNDSNTEVFLKRWSNKHLTDEDCIAFEDGIALLVEDQGESSSITYKWFDDEKESASWSRVAQLQHLLHQYRDIKIVHDQTDSLSQEIQQLVNGHEEWPKDAAVVEWVGLTCHALGYDGLSEKFFRQALQLGESHKSLAMLARFELNRGNLEEAGRHLMALLEARPNNGSDLHLHGVYLMQCGKFSEAVEAFHRAIQCEGDRKKAQLGMGMAYVGMGQTRDAWDVFTQNANENPDDIESMNWVIRTGTELADWKSLSKLLLRFVQRNPADGDMRFALASVHVRQGNSQEAQSHLQTLKHLNPEYDGIQDLAHAIDSMGVNLSGVANS
ncbi:glycosyltransferase [Candidatus Nitrospira salsa]